MIIRRHHTQISGRGSSSSGSSSVKNSRNSEVISEIVGYDYQLMMSISVQNFPLKSPLSSKNSTARQRLNFEKSYKLKN